jgi:hypothetical protein
MENKSAENEQTENSEALTLKSLKSEIETLQLDVCVAKRQNTSLKIMLYAGFVVIMMAFFYSSGIFKQSQEHNVEANFYDMRNRINRELLLIQKSLFGEILSLQEQLEKASLRGPSPAELADIVERMNTSIKTFHAQGGETQELVDEIQQHSRQFMETYNLHVE